MKLSTLVLCDDLWHSAELIRRGLDPLTEARGCVQSTDRSTVVASSTSASVSSCCGWSSTPPRSEAAFEFDFEFISDAGQWSLASLNDFAVVIVAKANHVNSSDLRPWLTIENQSAFRNFVRNGGGLFAIHGGIGYRDIPEMRGVIGGAFLDHPELCPVIVEPKPPHALTQGVEAFTEIDEQYQMVLDDLDADVFLRSRSRHGEQPAGWTRTEGAGRVCVLTPGHNPEVWCNRNFQTLLRNGLCWLANPQ